MKCIVLCADDYGQNFAVSQAIVELFEKKRISATSCLSTSLDWPLHSKLLQPFRGQADFGLHFNLSEGSPLSEQFINQYGSQFPSLSKLIIQAYLKKLDKEVIQAEFEAQLERLVTHLGQVPNFIDGHQHIHQLPIIREVIINIWENQLKKHRVYLRCTYNPSVYLQWKKSAFIKSLIIQTCGAKALKNELVKHHIPHNNSFEGIYQFSKATHYSQLFPLFLQRISDQGLIMCHPGLKGDEADAISRARYQEYLYFKSERFVYACQTHDIKLGQLSSGIF